ncbi:transporter substrate-binding domain-containing protein [Candidatus Magnetominusculus xianensis]|uniref:ABC transporter substrate-binding protein n=1 Tax=Candidatus Magnetominusculus xianensis TaxID=1748249 RepID=A0ABR5SIX1_9BACT|nr:transporter substrate-binding domain-containing protein [Candidatus Magnetominusculus xianensis]KWT92932.1 ABC transporter substrate-binding protein [Candidatus Magnetominusculus xianensis]MBF0402936.1 transporter substrate-binding domain-containing protein [Nitrospirota bacterium]
MAALRILILILSIYAPADAEQESYKVGVPLVPGICQRHPDNGLSGFAVDMWRETALRSSLKYELGSCGSIPECMAKFFSGSLDIVIIGIQPSRENSAIAVFSRPVYVSGIRILTRDKQQNPLLADINALTTLYSPMVIQSMLVFLIFVLIFGNVLWLLERKDDALISRSYKSGISDAMWCVLAIKTTIGFGDVVPKNSHARLLSILIWLVGLLLINLITADIVSEFAATKMKSSIIGLEDLKGKKIAAVNDNITISELNKIGAVVVVKPTLEAVYEEMKTGKAFGAALYAGVVTVYAKRAAADGLSVKIIPGRYNNRYTSIAIRRTAMLKDPNLLNKINRAIDDMYEDSYMLFLKSKWLDEGSR